MNISLHNLINKLRKASQNKKLYVFLSCLCLTISFWLLNALGNIYTTNIDVEVDYVNNPQNHIIISELPLELSIEVKGLGFDLLGYKLKLSKKKISVDLSKIKGIRKQKDIFTTIIDLNGYRPIISKQLGDQITVNHIYPEKIDVLLDNKSSKLVKVEPLLNLSFENQYQLDGAVKIKPAVLTVTGPTSIIDTLNSVFTEEISFEKLEETTTFEASLNSNHKLQKLKMEMEKVIVFIPVEKFTESTIMIPINYINVPDSVELKAIPKEVELKFMVPLSKLSNINLSKFNINVDYLDVNDNYSKLKVNLTNYPDYLKSIMIKPAKVEYILKKK